MLLTRIITFIIGAGCMFQFFTYDSYEWAREEKVMVVSAKASTAQDGKFKGAFLIYRELKGVETVGDPRTVLVDQSTYDTANVGDVKVEYERSTGTYVIFFIGLLSIFIFGATIFGGDLMFDLVAAFT